MIGYYPNRPGVLDSGRNPGGKGHKVPGLNLRALNCCLTLKFGVSIERYVQLAKIKKKIEKFSKTTEKSIFLKKNRKNVVITKMSAIRPKFKILSSSFLQTSLFL